MSDELHLLMRTLHIAVGFGGFVLGAGAIVLPKFGRTAGRHRWVGRAYAICMLGMAALSVPLALRSGNILLLTIAVLTLGWVAAGWLMLRRALAVRGRDGERFTALLRWHIVWMGSSYIGAWTAFLVNVEPLGAGPLRFWLYAIGPTIVGTLLIQRAVTRYAGAKRRVA